MVGKWWCNMDWYVVCGMECGTLCDVERGWVWAVTHGSGSDVMQMWLVVGCRMWWCTDVWRYVHIIVGCGIRCDQSDVEWCKLWSMRHAVHCCVKVWCDAICGGVHKWCGQYMVLSEYGVEYMECGVMWYVSNAKCPGAMHNVADMVRFEIWYCKVE